MLSINSKNENPQLSSLYNQVSFEKFELFH